MWSGAWYGGGNVGDGGALSDERPALPAGQVQAHIVPNEFSLYRCLPGLTVDLRLTETDMFTNAVGSD